MNVLKATTNHPDNGERVRNLLRGREALPAQPENRFQHVQESDSSTAGNDVMASLRTTHHTIHRRFDSWLDSAVTTVKNAKTAIRL